MDVAAHPVVTSRQAATRTCAGRAPLHTLSRGARRLAAGVASRELLQHVSQWNAARSQQHHRVEPQIRDLLDDAAITLAAERRGDNLRGFLADLPAHRRLALAE